MLFGSTIVNIYIPEHLNPTRYTHTGAQTYKRKPNDNTQTYITEHNFIL